MALRRARNRRCLGSMPEGLAPFVSVAVPNEPEAAEAPPARAKKPARKAKAKKSTAATPKDQRPVPNEPEAVEAPPALAKKPAGKAKAKKSAPKDQPPPAAATAPPAAASPVAGAEQPVRKAKVLSPAATPATPPPAQPSPAADQQPQLKSILKKKREREAQGAPDMDAMLEKARKRVKKTKAAPDAAAQPPPANPPNNAAFIVCGTYDSSIAGYNFSPKTRKLTPVFAVKPHHGYVSGVAVSDKWIISAGSDETICLYTARRLKQIGTCGSEGTPTKLVMKGNNVLLGSDTGMLMILRSSDWVTIWKEHAHKKRINDVELHPSGSVGISVGEDAFLKMWDFSKCKILLQVKLPKAANLVRFTPDGALYVLVFEARVAVFKTDAGAEVSSLAVGNELHCAQFLPSATPGSARLLCGAEDGSLQLLSIDAEGACASVWTAEAHPTRVKSLAVCTVGSLTMAVSVCSSGHLVVWEVNDDSTVTEMKRLCVGTRFTCVSAIHR
ncbi:hypothetical protein DIPPA_17500 [Diplonema papillatum]|nr:hypothetical protein DIPPA_17500 [Diplonema papillatum]